MKRNKQQEIILCACGCSQTKYRYDKNWRESKYIPYHNLKSKEIIKKMQETKKTKFKEGKLKIWNKGLTMNDSRVRDYTLRKVDNNKLRRKINGFSYNWDKKTIEKMKQPLSEETKYKMSKTKLELYHNNNLKVWNKNLTHEKDNRVLSKEDCHLWKGGISFEPYGLEFNNQLREQIRLRDSYRCQECFRHQDELRTKSNRKYKMNIHHIDFNKQNNNPDNLISLCRNCHAQTLFNREHWIKYYQNKTRG